MLALMPQSPAVSNFYAPTLPTMSLAVLPSSPLSYDPPSIPTLLPTGPPSSKRPKLSLNTASAAPVFGKNATSLRLETLSATSPTSRNTFRNAHDSERKNTLNRTKPALTSIATNVQTVPDSTPTTTQPRSIAETIEAVFGPSPLASQSIESTSTIPPPQAPYKLPLNTASILTNGPIPRVKAGHMPFSQTLPMLPVSKKVLFRAQLTEVIETTKFTMRHSDIKASLAILATTEADRQEEGGVGAVQNAQEDASDEKSTMQTPRTGEKRDSSDDESYTCPATPVAGRQKRHRQWRWTLGHVSPASPGMESPGNEAVVGS